MFEDLLLIELLYTDMATDLLVLFASEISEATQTGIMPDISEVQTQITRRASQALSAALPEIRKSFNAAAVESISRDNRIYEQAGRAPISLDTPSMRNILNNRISAATATVRRITSAVNINAEELYRNTLAEAVRKTQSGELSYQQAAAEAVDALNREGIAHFEYASGRNIPVESAVLMNIRTQVAQAAARLTEQGMIERGCTHVVTTAHNGARVVNFMSDEDRYKSHVEWQGKIFQWGELSAENDLQNSPDNGTIITSDMEIGRSLGAMARNYDVIAPDGTVYKFAEGTRLQNAEIFAGNGAKNPLNEFVKEGLSDEYGGDPESWQHAKAIGYIDDMGEHRKAEVHWFQSPTAGKVKFKVKEWLDED